jgi:5'-3' exonuclease
MNLIIDGNAFLNVAISIVKTILKNDIRVGETYYVSDLMEDDKFMLKHVSKDTFRNFSVNYLGSILAPFKDNISSVFFVFDSKSWRKKYIKDHFEIHGEGDFSYKGNRKYDDKMYLFFDYFQNEILHAIANEYGIVVSRAVGAEGDDIIAYICENLNDDICIWTVDKDMTQLVEATNRRIMVIMPKQMTKYKKLYTSPGINDVQTTPKEFDILNFDYSSISNATVSNIVHDLTRKDYQHFEVDVTNDLLTKFLAGDVSDNIPRVHPKMTAAKVTKSVESIREEFRSDNIIALIDSGDSRIISRLNDIACDSLKIKDPDERQMILNKLNRNKTIIRLHTSLFPADVLEAIKQSVDLTSRRRFDYFKFKKNYKH